MGCPPASKFGSLAPLLLFLFSQAHSTHSLVSDGPGYVSCSQKPKERRVGCISTCLSKEAGWKSSPFTDGSFSFLCRAQEATELLSEDLLQVRHGLGWQACVCLCLGVGTCPAPACHSPCQHVQVMGLGSARVPEGDFRTMALRDWQAPATRKGFPSRSQRDES